MAAFFGTSPELEVEEDDEDDEDEDASLILALRAGQRRPHETSPEHYRSAGKVARHGRRARCRRRRESRARSAGKVRLLALAVIFVSAHDGDLLPPRRL